MTKILNNLTKDNKIIIYLKNFNIHSTYLF